MSEHRPPVVFIHGLWIHATSWHPWVELFDQVGYQAHAPGWPGVAGHGRRGPGTPGGDRQPRHRRRRGPLLAYFETLPTKPT